MSIALQSNCNATNIVVFALFLLGCLMILPVHARVELPSVDTLPAKLQLTKKGKQLFVEAYIPRGITESTHW